VIFGRVETAYAVHEKSFSSFVLEDVRHGIHHLLEEVFFCARQSEVEP
jgi:hypothetical protein